MAQEVFGDIPLHNLWIFPGDEPGDLEADQVAAGVEWGGTEPVIFRMPEPLRRGLGALARQVPGPAGSGEDPAHRPSHDAAS